MWLDYRRILTPSPCNAKKQTPGTADILAWRRRSDYLVSELGYSDFRLFRISSSHPQVTQPRIYRPPWGCACSFFVIGAACLAFWVFGLLSEQWAGEPEVPGEPCCGAVPLLMAALAVMAGIASRTVRVTVDDHGLRLSRAFCLSTLAFSWEEVEWWRESLIVDGETGQARKVAEFHIRGWRSPFTLEPAAVAVPGMEPFLADLRARIGDNERATSA